MLVGWTLFRSPGLLNKFDLDWIIGKGEQLLKFIGNLFWDRRLTTRFLDCKRNYKRGIS